MKITMQNLRKLQRMRVEGVDVQERVQHWIDTEPELLIQVLGGEGLAEDKCRTVAEELKRDDAWELVLNTVATATEKHREQAREKQRRELEPLVRRLRFGDILEPRVLKTVLANSSYDTLTFDVGGNTLGVDRRCFRDIVTACYRPGVSVNPPKIVNAAVNSIILHYRTARSSGTIKLSLTPTHDPCAVHVPRNEHNELSGRNPRFPATERKTVAKETPRPRDRSARTTRTADVRSFRF